MTIEEAARQYREAIIALIEHGSIGGHYHNTMFSTFYGVQMHDIDKWNSIEANENTEHATCSNGEVITKQVKKVDGITFFRISSIGGDELCSQRSTN